HGDEDRAVGSVPGRDLMAPPELARDAPWLNVAHPLEEGAGPCLRLETGSPLFDRFDRGLRQRRRVDVPLLGQVRLDRNAATIAVGDLVDVPLDLLEQPLRLHVGDDALARLEP